MSLERPRFPRLTVRCSTSVVALTVAFLSVALACRVGLAAPADEDDKAPTVVEARTLDSDDERGIVVATGEVEVSKGRRSVRADKITYNKKTKVVVAEGNVRLVEPSGEIMFAEYAELTDDLKQVFVDNVGMLLVDNSRVAGNEAERRPDGSVRISRGVYSPCDLCAEDPSRPPLWQLRGVRVVRDKEKLDVYYRDATLEFMGFPVAYTPYFSHPDSSVKRRSGFLMPTWGQRATAGTFVSAGYYYDIAPDKDATFRVTPFSSGAFMLSSEYRERFSNGSIQVNLDSAYANLISESDKTSKGKTYRGLATINGRFNLNDDWRTGFIVERASDRTFIKQYLTSEDATASRDLLTSRAYVEGFNDRNYASVNAYAFQDLRYGYSKSAPVVLPKFDWNAFGEPGALLGGRWQLDTGFLALGRDGGTRTARLSVVPSWRGSYVLGGGLVADASARAWLISKLSTAYDDPRTTGVESLNGKETRALPEADVTLRWPLARQGAVWTQTLEPIVQLKTAPRWKNLFKTKNEDSLDVELDETTLFLPSRYGGLDRLEGGSRVTYGLRGRGVRSGMSVGGFLGQSYSLSGDPGYMTGSGLESELSDLVGTATASWNGWVNVDYGFRYSTTTGKLGRQTASTSFGVDKVRLFTSYTTLNKRQDVDGNSLAAIDQITGGFTGKIDNHWTYSLAQSYNFIGSPEPMTAVASLVYQDECFMFRSTLKRDFTAVTVNTDPGVTAYFELSFKNLGQFGFSSSVGGTSSASTTQ